MKKHALIFIFFISISSISNGQHWQPLRDGIDWMGVNNMYEDTVDNLLYVVGAFKTVDSMNIRGIAKWNGVKWDSLGSGMDDNQSSFPQNTWAVCKFQNEIYAGGAFWKTGNIWTKFIAKWNGTNWDSLNSRLNSSVENFLVHDNELFVCGVFSNAGGITTNNIAKWDGTQWTGMGFPNYASRMSCMVFYKSELYVGGTIQDSLGYPVNIARWDGVNWKPVGNGISGGMAFVSSFAIYNDELYVGGYFLKVDGNAGNFIQKWNGFSWSGVGGEFDDYVKNLWVYNNELYAGGVFTKAGGVQANRIAKWNGTEWCGLGSTIWNTVTSIKTYNDSLIIGGGFNLIDGDTINSIAKWVGGNYVDTCGNTSGIQELTINQNELQLYPNPFTNSATLQTSKPLQNASLFIFDMLGEEVKSFHNLNGTEINIFRNGMKSGLYFFTLLDTKGFIGNGKLIIE